MPIEIKMPALSPTMEEGTLAKWLVKEGDPVKSGDVMAEIETDKATMEFEAVDEGTVGRILVPEGTDGVKVGTVIMVLNGEDEASSAPPTEAGSERKEAEESEPAVPAPAAEPSPKTSRADVPVADETPAAKSEWPAPESAQEDAPPASTAPPASPPSGDRVKASPLARRIAAANNVDLATLTGSGPNGRIVKADLAAPPAGQAPASSEVAAPLPSAAFAAPKPAQVPDIPHEATKLSNIRKTIARRLTESKQQVPHIYLTVDVRLDRLLALRSELNASLEKRGVKLSVNDLMIKALGVALMQVPKCNVMYTPDQLISFQRADISVAVSTPTGLITPVIVGADAASLSAISTRMKDLGARARDGKLKPEEYAGGTASLSNMGMYGIKQFDAVINPPQGMILAVGAGEKRPYVIGDALGIATVMSATGSFDHRAIDGADGAELMQAFKALVEAPLGMFA